MRKLPMLLKDDKLAFAFAPYGKDISCGDLLFVIFDD